MDFLRRLFGGQAAPPKASKWATAPQRTGPAAAAVVPAQLVPNWPIVARWPGQRTLTTTERNALPFEATVCPSCRTEVAKPPKGRKRCIACGEYMYVRVIDDQRRRLVTEAELGVPLPETAESVRRAAEVEEAEQRWYRAVIAAGVTLCDPPEDGEELDVVGESHHQEDLAALMAALRDGPDATELWTAARLVPEPLNPYDRNAVRVEVHGRLVGHLSREDAEEIKPWLRKVARRSRPTYVLARIAGGRVTDGIVGPIGVTLENLPDDILG